MNKYEFYRNDISIEIYAKKEGMTRLQLLLEAEKEIRREVIRESTNGGSPNRKHDGN